MTYNSVVVEHTKDFFFLHIFCDLNIYTPMCNLDSLGRPTLTEQNLRMVNQG